MIATNTLGVFSAGIASLIALCSAAQANELKCPPKITVDQKVNNPPAGWIVSYNGLQNELASVTIYEGPPEQGASLVYDDQQTGADTITQIWKLPPSANGYWLLCGYSNTAAQVAQKISTDAARCEVVRERNVSFGDGRRAVRSAICK